MDKLDRVFNRQNMPVHILVAMLDHGCQRGRFARTGRAGDQHQTTRLERDVGKNSRRIELVQAQDGARDRPKHRTGAAQVIEGVHPKPRQAGYFK